MPESIADHLAIRSVLERNAFGLDRRDYDMVESCYAKDATGEFGGEPMESREAIVNYARVRLPRFLNTMHHITNAVIEVDGNRANSECYAIAYMVENDLAGQRILLRGLRYVDQFNRADGQWLITFREHLPQWMVVLPTTPLG